MATEVRMYADGRKSVFEDAPEIRAVPEKEWGKMIVEAHRALVKQYEKVLADMYREDGDDPDNL